VEVFEHLPDDEAVPVLHLTAGDAEKPGRFLVGVVLHGHQVEDGTVGRVGDRRDGMVDDDARIPEAIDECERHVAHGLGLGELIGHIFHLSVMFVQYIFHGDEQPRADVDRFLHFIEKPDEYLLCHILGRVGIAGARVERTVDHGVVPAVGLGEICVFFIKNLSHGPVAYSNIPRDMHSTPPLRIFSHGALPPLCLLMSFKQRPGQSFYLFPLCWREIMGRGGGVSRGKQPMVEFFPMNSSKK